MNLFLRNNKQIKISTARSGNVLGGGDYSKNRIIPDILNSIYNKKDLIIRNPNHIRPWQHVIEPIYGYLKLAEYLFLNKVSDKGHSWNFGPKYNSFISVYELLAKIKKLKKLKKFYLKKTNLSKQKH